MKIKNNGRSKQRINLRFLFKYILKGGTKKWKIIKQKLKD